MEEEIRNYEITFLASSTLKEKEAKDIFDKIKKEIAESEGTISQEEEPKLINLSYPIKKENKAYLAVIEFKLDSGKLAEFKEKVEKENKILRYLVIKKKERKEKAIKEKSEKKSKEKEPEEKKKANLENIEEKIEEITK